MILVSDEALSWSTRDPGREALITPGAPPLTYGALGALVRAWSRDLPRGSRIAITPLSTPEGVAAVLGIWAAGSSVVLMHQHLNQSQAEAVLARSGAQFEVAGDMSIHRLWDSDGYADPDEMLVGLTSGTSGPPKLFARTHDSWLATFERSDHLFALRPGERVAVPGVIDHSHFLYGAVHALARGATVDLGGTRGTEWGAVKVMYSVPTIAADLREAGTRLTQVRAVLSSGATWPTAAKRAFRRLLPDGARVFDFYGAGELSFVSVHEGEGQATCVGRPFLGVDVRLTDTETSSSEGNRTVGLIEVRSDMLFSGYLDANGRPEPPRHGWATAGDRGYVDEQGRLHLSGRESRMFTRGALNVEPELVERVMVGHPAVLEAVCVPRSDSRWGAEPVAFVRLSAPVMVHELREWCAQRLDVIHRPVQIHVVESLPVTHRGKIDHRELGARAGAH